MGVSGARKFRVSIRLLLSILAVGCVLLASVSWNFQLYRRAEHQRLRAIAAERVTSAQAEQQRLQVVADQKRTKAEAEQASMLAKRQAERARDAARVRQLYQELNNLSQLNERILLEFSNPLITSPKKSQPTAPGTP